MKLLEEISSSKLKLKKYSVSEVEDLGNYNHFLDLRFYTFLFLKSANFGTKRVFQGPLAMKKKYSVSVRGLRGGRSGKL